MALAQGVVFRGSYLSCPAMQGGATVTTVLTTGPPFFLQI